MKLFLFLSSLALLGAGELTFADFWAQPNGKQWWRLQDGVISGGSKTEKVPHNTFLTSAKRYANFELSLDVRLKSHGSKNPNAGIQIRSERVTNHHEMIGYQIDMGKGYWGKIYDESRRRKVIGDHLGPEAAKALQKGWNHYRILSEGPRIQVWLNGVKTVDFLETNKEIPLEGLVALQAHSGDPFEASYRNIVIRELPPTPGVMTWKALGEEGRKLKKSK
jgi:hypothetical protein